VSGYLLDTNIVSEVRKQSRANPSVMTWLKSVDDDDLFLSVLVLGEIRKGIELARNNDPAKAMALESWLKKLEEKFTDRVLPITPAIAEQWGRLSAIQPISTIDGLLAASAIIHDLTFVTRNTADVSGSGVRCLNPFGE
jgi:predicted nucleic acid-binding protein